jgi:hypothetical protein
LGEFFKAKETITAMSRNIILRIYFRWCGPPARGGGKNTYSTHLTGSKLNIGNTINNSKVKQLDSNFGTIDSYTDTI